jgi:ferredoxin, 2Fe-2S
MAQITLHLQDKDGSQHTVKARIGRSLMQAAVDAGLDGIAADCGGSLSCATCHIIVAPEWLAALPPASDDEAAMLEMTAAPNEPGSRLACQLKLAPTLDGLHARLPATQY